MRWACPILICLATAPVLADRVTLRDGAIVEGDLKRTEEGWRLTLRDGSVRELVREEVVSVEADSTRNSGNDAMIRLESLRRSLQVTDSAQSAIDQYENFLRNAAGTSAEEPANADLELWRKRLAEGQIKQGSNWMSPADAREVRDQSLQLAMEARNAMKRGAIDQAAPLIAQSLELDPANPTALYLKSLIDYDQRRPVDARKGLDRVNQLVPNHGPTLNNLAVVNWNMRQWSSAMTLYNQAMAALPVHQTLLDNVAEALHALPTDQQSTTVTQQTRRRFVEQDRDLQFQMAERGFQRWGGTYVSNDQIATYQAREAQVHKQLDQYAAQFGEVEGRIRDIEVRGERNDATLRQIEASSFVRDYQGRIIRLSYPPVYYEIEAENIRLRKERDDLTRRLDDLRKLAASAKASIPAQEFTGIQSLIGPEGAPFAGELAPTTMPTEAMPADNADAVLDVQVSGPSTQPAAE